MSNPLSTHCRCVWLCLLALLCITTQHSAVADASNGTNGCDFLKLLDCFMKTLGSWARTLYTVKNNVVTISKGDCAHLHAMSACIKDTHEDGKHHCDRDKVLDLSYSITDILIQRHKTGTFLKSYYLLEYACSDKGQEVLDKHRDCLNKEKIGDSTLAASHYLTRKYLDDAHALNGNEPKSRADVHKFRKEKTGDACTALQEKVTMYKQSLGLLCDGEAAKMMCESLARMFTNVYSQKLEGCVIDCDVAAKAGVDVAVGEPEPSNGHAAGSKTDENGGGADTDIAARNAISSATLLVCSLISVWAALRHNSLLFS